MVIIFEMENRNGKLQIISTYFHLVFAYREIKACLQLFHNITLSLRHLKRLLNTNGLYRRKQRSELMDVALFIMNQIEHSGQMHGYRWLHLKAIQNGMCVSQETIRILLQILDTEGVALRRRCRLRRRKYHTSGPNDCWHLDSYDKLKPYGICINGCIDGFSRNIIWLEASTSSSNPRLIANYFMRAVQMRNGCPIKVWADRGTENTYVKDLQIFLRRNNLDRFAGHRSFLTGKSTANQRIESWWGILRKECIQYWMNLFSSLKDDGMFTGYELDKSLIQFCFMGLIQVK